MTTAFPIPTSACPGTGALGSMRLTGSLPSFFLDAPGHTAVNVIQVSIRALTNQLLDNKGVLSGGLGT